jgi:hypothetical protein
VANIAGCEELLASLVSRSIAFSAASSAAASASAVDSPVACPWAFLDLARYLGDLLVRDRCSLDVDLPNMLTAFAGAGASRPALRGDVFGV